MVERENFHRFCGILLDTGANVLREVFLDKYVGTSTLLRYFALHKNYLNLLQPITIRKDQFELLYPPVGGAPVIEDIDITLLCVLFRNLDTQTTPNDSVWIDPKTHLTYQADVTRIRLARNALIAHVSSASMCNTTYNNEVSNLTTIYHRLVQSLPAGKMSSTELKEMIDRELNGPLQKSLDRKVKGLEESLVEWYKQDEDSRKAILANQEENRKIIKEFSENQEDIKKDIKCLQDRQYDMNRQRDSLSREKKDVNIDAMKKRIAHSKVVLDDHKDHADKFFVETQQYRTGKKILDQHGKILITGNPGEGKTYLAYQLLLTFLEDKKTLSPLIISSADEWTKLVDSSTEMVLVVDDMCGKYGLLQGDLKIWNENARFIQALIDTRKHTVIFTMRTHIHESIAGGLQLESDISDPQCLSKITLNMENDNIKLREADKIEFATRYLKKYGLTLKEVLQLCRIDQVSIGFPLLCRAAERIDDKSTLFDLFARPLAIMTRELIRLRNDKSVSYGSLVLVMLAGGKLASKSINEFLVTSDRTKEVKLIFHSCGVPDVNLVDVQLATNALCRTYLLFNERDELYSFVHDTTEEAVFLSYGKLHQQETLKLCSLRSLCKLCRIKNDESHGLSAQSSTSMFILQPQYHDILIDRFIKALETQFPGDFATIGEADVWSSVQFRKLFMDKCKIIHALTDTDQNSLLVHAANANNIDLGIELLRGMKQIRAEIQQQAVLNLTKAAKASCVHNDLRLFKHFMETGDVNSNDILPLTVEKGSEAAMEFLLQTRADVNYRSENGESLLHIACLHGRLDMVILLQSTYSQSVNYCDRKGRSICHSAASGGNVDIMNFLVQKGADPLCKDVDGMNILDNACFEGKKEMAFHLMDRYATMLCNVGKEGFTVFHCVAHGGSIAILDRVSELINIPTRTDDSSKLNVSSRQVSEIFKGIFNSLYKLINVYSRADPNKYSDYNRHSAQKESYDENNANLKTRTETGVTVLHMACLSGQLEMTKHLVEKYPDMINAVDNRHETPAHYAAKSSNILVLQYLIARGLDPSSRTATQETLLHKSSLAGQLEMTKYLVEKYPDMIHQVDICKETVAHYAAQSSNVSVLKYLIDQGLNPLCRTDTQQTLLHKSCIRGQLEMTQYLFGKYPDMIKMVDNCTGTPAHCASQSNNVSVLQYLIQEGQDPWCRTFTQETFLHKSCLAGQLEITMHLHKKYPDMIQAVDNCKGTPAHYAAESNNVSVLQYLIDQGFDPWCRTATQETLLHRSCIKGQLKLTQYLHERYPNMINAVDICNGTPAHYAAKSGNVLLLQYLINQGINPWRTTNTGATLLHISCMNGQLEMTHFLVKKYPAMVHELDNCKGTSAHYAAQSNNVNVLLYLIDKGIDPQCRTVEQYTLLHMSCRARQLKMTKYLVEKYPDMINEIDNCKGTPVYYVIESGNISILKYLIEQCLDPRCRTATKETLLHRSCIAGQLEMSKFLVEKYPNMIHKFDNCKRTPAHCAAESGKVPVLQYVISQGLEPYTQTSKQQTLLHISCSKGQLEMTQYLVEKYPNMINEVDNLKNTPVQCAAVGGNICVLQYLVRRGANPWCKTYAQETLLHLSCMHLEMVQYLVKTYPNMIHELDICKRTPSHHAAKGGNISVLQYLICHGLNPRCRTSTQETLLHMACSMGQLEMTRYLVETYPDMIKEVDNCNGTPAHSAASNGNVSLLKYLINEGIDPWCTTNTRRTLLHVSCMSGRLEMTQYLVTTYPTMVHELDNCKGTSAHYAAQSNNVNVLLYLIDKGIDPQCRTVEQYTLLHMSCRAGQLEMTKYLFEKYPDMINKVSSLEYTPVQCAAVSGSVLVLQYLIDEGVDPWSRTSTRHTLLHLSFIEGHLEMIQFLVEKYPDMINELADCKRSVAQHVAEIGNISVLQYLIDLGIDPLCRSAKRVTLLHLSCFFGHLEMTKYLVEKYPDMMNDVDDNKLTPAHFAARSKNVSILLYLIDHGIDPWCRTIQQETLLHMSCLAGQLEMTKYLVEKYPDMINAVDDRKFTPAHYAAGFKEEKYHHRFHNIYKCKMTHTHGPDASANVPILRYLIGHGLDPYCRALQQETLLHISSFNGFLDVTQYLVEKYPNMINEVDNLGNTPVHYAAVGGNICVLQYLVRRGANPWCKTYAQETLLHLSCMHLEMVQYLVKTYPNMIHELDICKRTPSHHAAKGGNISVLQYLICHGLNPRCRTSTQETLLHMACNMGQLEMTRYLVETYPDMIKEVDNCNGTPAHSAASNGNVSLLKYLINEGIDPWCTTNTRRTLLHVSCMSGRLEMVQYLVNQYPNMKTMLDIFLRKPAFYAAQSTNASVSLYLNLNP